MSTRTHTHTHLSIHLSVHLSYLSVYLYRWILQIYIEIDVDMCRIKLSVDPFVHQLDGLSTYLSIPIHPSMCSCMCFLTYEGYADMCIYTRAQSDIQSNKGLDPDGSGKECRMHLKQLGPCRTLQSATSTISPPEEVVSSFAEYLITRFGGMNLRTASRCQPEVLKAI